MQDTPSIVSMCSRNFLCHIPAPDRIQRKPHGKEAICILAKSLPVKKIAPSADHLACDQSAATGIQHQPTGIFFT